MFIGLTAFYRVEAQMVKEQKRQVQESGYVTLSPPAWKKLGAWFFVLFGFVLFESNHHII